MSKTSSDINQQGGAINSATIHKISHSGSRQNHWQLASKKALRT